MHNRMLHKQRHGSCHEQTVETNPVAAAALDKLTGLFPINQLKLTGLKKV